MAIKLKANVNMIWIWSNTSYWWFIKRCYKFIIVIHKYWTPSTIVTGKLMLMYIIVVKLNKPKLDEFMFYVARNGLQHICKRNNFIIWLF